MGKDKRDIETAASWCKEARRSPVFVFACFFLFCCGFALTAPCLAASWLQKKTKNLWRKRWYEVSENKLAWYSTAAKKQEIGNLPLFLITGVEAGPKATQFRVRTKDANKPEILLQAASTDQRDEWVKVVSDLLEQRQVRQAEDAQAGSQTTRPGAPHSANSLIGVSQSADESYDRDDHAPDDDADVEAPSASPASAAADHGSYLTKAAHEKFAVALRQLVLEQDVAGVRAMLDPKPPRDALIWFFQKELDRTVLHFAVDGGDLKITDLLVGQEPRLLEMIDHLGFTPLHVAAYRGHVDMGELLLKLGANPVCTDNNGRWPVYVALSAGHHNFAKMLLRKNCAGPGWQAAHVAAIGGVQAHLETAADITAKHQPTLVTALHLAASSDSVGSAEAVLYLIEKGIDVNATDAFGRTPLFFAAAAGALQPLRLLLAKGADASRADTSKRVALHFAAGCGHAEVCELLIEKGGGLHSPEDEFGWTPLHLACQSGSAPTVRALLAKQARLEARGMRATTPLMLCCSSETAAIAHLLLHAGADANAINRDSQTALFEAVDNKSLVVCKMLLENDVNVNRLDDADEGAIFHALDWPEGFLLLMEKGADPNKTSEEGNSLLYEMALRGQLDLVKVLCEKGADVEGKTSDLNRTALHAAAAEGHLEVVKYLIEKKVSLDAFDKNGLSALHLACANGSAGVVQALLEAKCQSSPSSGDGNTPMHVACSKGHEKCVALLKQAKVRIDAENCLLKTPLHLAAEAGSYACVSLLLESCPDSVVVARDSAGKTALHYSLKAGDVDSSTSLIWAGCSPSQEDNDKVRPFHLAARLGKRKVLAEMLDKEPTCDPGWLDSSKRNPIHYCCAGGSAESLQILLELCGERKAELINARDNHGTTALHFACEFNFAEVVRMLLANGASCEIQNDAGLFALHTAAKKGNQSLEVLLALPKSLLVDTRDSEGLSPLLIACLHGNDMAAATLLDAGADAKLIDEEGIGAAHACVESGNARLLKLVVEKGGASVSCVDKSGSQALHLAAASGNVPCLEVLMHLDKIDLNAVDMERESRTALHLAAAGGHAQFVEMLVRDSRVHVNARNAAGQTALHLASMNGKLDVVKVLLANRQDLDVKCADTAGRTVLHNVALHDTPELTKLFLHFIDPNATTTQLVTPLHEAAVRGSLRAAKILLDAGALVNVAAVQGLTPLHNAASFAQNDIIELLVKNGAEIDSRSERGLTPLMCAAAMSHSRTIVLLVKLGAEVDAIDVLGENALMKAATAGSHSACTVLIERGADVNLRNAKNQSAYERAKVKGHARVCQLLQENA